MNEYICYGVEYTYQTTDKKELKEIQSYINQIRLRWGGENLLFHIEEHEDYTILRAMLSSPITYSKQVYDAIIFKFSRYAAGLPHTPSSHILIEPPLIKKKRGPTKHVSAGPAPRPKIHRIGAKIGRPKRNDE